MTGDLNVHMVALMRKFKIWFKKCLFLPHIGWTVRSNISGSFGQENKNPLIVRMKQQKEEEAEIYHRKQIGLLIIVVPMKRDR